MKNRPVYISVVLSIVFTVPLLWQFVHVPVHKHFFTSSVNTAVEDQFWQISQFEVNTSCTPGSHCCGNDNKTADNYLVIDKPLVNCQVCDYEFTTFNFSDRIISEWVCQFYTLILRNQNILVNLRTFSGTNRSLRAPPSLLT